MLVCTLLLSGRPCKNLIMQAEGPPILRETRLTDKSQSSPPDLTHPLISGGGHTLTRTLTIPHAFSGYVQDLGPNCIV
jgi:hypothetical protein